MKRLKNQTAVAIINIVYPLITIAAVLCAWAIAAAALNKPLILPSIGETLKGLGELMSQSVFYVQVGYTLLRLAVGYIISFVLAITAAICAAVCKPVKKLLSPLAAISRAIPTMSVILLCLLWVSNKILPVVVSVIIICPLLYTNILGAIEGVDSKLIEMSKVYSVPLAKRIKELYIPLTMPDILTSVRSTLGLSLKLMIAGEVMSNTAYSIGQAMNMSNMYLETAQLFAWTIVAIILAALLEGAVIAARRLALRWKYA
ncbi:MAG: ABC transporter permease subunit [Clostridia bacterium]|nr:ABC transporter permease subunit [Clostridia bacterium]